MLAIRLPEDIEARLDNLAKRTGRSKTFYALKPFWNTWKTWKTSTSPNWSCAAWTAAKSKAIP